MSNASDSEPARPLRVADLLPGGLLKLQPARVQLYLGLAAPGDYSGLEPQTALTFGEALVYWVISQLIQSQVLPEHLCLRAGQLFGRAIYDWGNSYWTLRNRLDDLPKIPPVLLLADRRYLSGPPDLHRCYDFLQGSWCQSPAATFEGISYNFMALAAAETARLDTTNARIAGNPL